MSRATCGETAAALGCPIPLLACSSCKTLTETQRLTDTAHRHTDRQSERQRDKQTHRDRGRQRNKTAYLCRRYCTHVYFSFGGKQTKSDWDTAFGYLAPTYPLIATEFGNCKRERERGGERQRE